MSPMMTMPDLLSQQNTWGGGVDRGRSIPLPTTRPASLRATPSVLPSALIVPGSIGSPYPTVGETAPRKTTRNAQVVTS